MVEWGAKTIPEGGYYAIPKRRYGDGVMIVGDSAGFVEVASLKGIHYAMQSGMFAARAIFDALKKKDTSARSLKRVRRAGERELHREGSLRAPQHASGVSEGRISTSAGIKAALMTVTGGALPGGKIESHADADVRARSAPPERHSCPTESSRSASSTRISNRATQRATTFRRTSSSARTFRPRSRSCTRTCVPRACTSATASGWS